MALDAATCVTAVSLAIPDARCQAIVRSWPGWRQPCALGFVAKTGKAVAVAIGPGPELLGKWDLVLVPPGQERFVYHAAAQLDGDAARWVRASTTAIANEAQRAIDALLDSITTPVAAAADRRALARARPPALRDPRRAHAIAHRRRCPLPQRHRRRAATRTASTRRSYRRSSSTIAMTRSPGSARCRRRGAASTRTPRSRRSTCSGPAEQVVAVPSRELGTQRVHVGRRERAELRFARRAPPHLVFALPVLSAQHALQHLLRRGRRQARRDAHEAGHPLR